MSKDSNQRLFPTFYLSGFECSTFIWRKQGRQNLVAATQHGVYMQEDYNLLCSLGISVSREGILWPLVDHQGEYDFSSLDPVLEAMRRTGIIPIWDLCHYGYPEDLDPLTNEFVERFTRYCRAAAEYVTSRLDGPHFFTPINEITFTSFMGGWKGWIAPFRKGLRNRDRLRLALCRADIAGVNAIREVYPQARMVHIDPVANVVAPREHPEEQDQADYETYQQVFLAWDILCGRQYPELGGSPETLDIIGCSNYAFSQMEYRKNGMHPQLPPGDDRIIPVYELIMRVWNRYHHPLIIGETSGMGEGRVDWLRDLAEESLFAIRHGADLQGICLFPMVDMPSWYTGEWLHNGFFDLVEEEGRLRRVPYEPYINELRRWQKEFRQIPPDRELDAFRHPVSMNDLRAAAQRISPQPDPGCS